MILNSPHVFRHATFWTENGILFGRYARDVVIDLRAAEEIVAERKQVFGNVYWAMFVDASEVLAIDSKARRYLSGKDACDFVTAGAIFTNNKLLQLIGNAWALLDKPILPTKIFSEKQEAVDWLQPYRYRAFKLNQNSRGTV